MAKQFFGKYRAIVKDTVDPEKRGRIKVECPSVYGKGNISKWCLPCFQAGIFAIPPKNSLVWIEFEEGDKNNPIWTGVFYTKTTFAELFDAEGYDPKNVMMRGYKDVFIRCPSKVRLNDIDKKSGEVSTGLLKSKGKEVQTK